MKDIVEETLKARTEKPRLKPAGMTGSARILLVGAKRKTNLNGFCIKIQKNSIAFSGDAAFLSKAPQYRVGSPAERSLEQSPSGGRCQAAGTP